MRWDNDSAQVIENSVEFHSALLSAHRKLGVATASDGNSAAAEAAADGGGGVAAQLQYSRRNFSYGSTPHSSWLAVFEYYPPLRAAIEDMRSGRCAGHDEYCVFGSSLGWLCFYASLTYGVHTTGYELVGPLVALASRLSLRHCNIEDAGSVTFHHADMLTADLSQVRVLVLTSHVWDKQLCVRLDAKLAAEMLPGSFVIDYNGRLAESQPRRFTVVASVTVPTSWAGDTELHVFRCHGSSRDEPATPGRTSARQICCASGLVLSGMALLGYRWASTRR